MSNFIDMLRNLNVFGSGRRSGRTSGAQAAGILQRVAEEQRRMNMATCTTGTGYWIDEVEQSPERTQELFNTPLYHYVPHQAAQQQEAALQATTTSAWYLNSTDSGTLTVDNLTVAQEALTADYVHQTYANGVAINTEAMGDWTHIATTSEPVPEPRIVPITDFSKWLMKKYNTDV